jgi:hypothetical protein
VRNAILALAALAAPMTACLDTSGNPAVEEADQALTSWGSWRNVAGNTNVSLATVTLAGRLYLFDKGLDNNVYMKTFTRGGGWTGWRAVGGQTDVPVAATVCWDGIYLVQKGMDGHVYVTNSGDGSAWGASMEVPGGGQTDAALSATCPSMGEQGLRIYMKGLDGRVYENIRGFSISPAIHWTDWSGWHEVGDGWVTNTSLGSFETTGGWGEVVLLFKGLNNHSYWKVFHADGYYSTSGTWSSWHEIGGTTNTALAGANNMIVAKGINDNAGYYKTYNPSSDSWSGWSSIGAGTTNAAYAITSYTGGPTSLAFGYYLFAKGINDNGIYLKSNAPLDPPAPPPPPPPPPGSTTDTATVNLIKQPIGSGQLAWATTFGVGIYGGRMKSITNPTFNNFIVKLLKAGKNSSQCSDSSAVIPLVPGAMTSDMTALYGVADPLVPQAIAACVDAPLTVTVPQAFPISVTYTH